MVKRIFLFFISLSTLAQSPQMPTEVFKASWKDLETPIGQSFCLEELEDKFFPKEGMSTSISCLVKCSNAAERVHQLSENFIPKDQGMRKGDGNLWASLSTTVKFWAEETCFHFAAQECQGLKKIDTTELVGVKSGEWLFSGKFSCGKSQEIIYSPFDPKIKKKNIDARSNKALQKNSELLSLSSDWRQPFGLHLRQKPAPLKDCSKKVAATFCYGDCISLNGEKNREYLASPSPLGVDTYEFCMDSLVEKIKIQPLPANILTHLCETQILSELKKISATGLTCASSRLETSCSDLNL